MHRGYLRYFFSLFFLFGVSIFACSYFYDYGVSKKSRTLIFVPTQYKESPPVIPQFPTGLYTISENKLQSVTMSAANGPKSKVTVLAGVRGSW